MLPIYSIKYLDKLSPLLHKVILNEIGNCNDYLVRVDNFIVENIDDLLIKIEKKISKLPKKVRKRTFSISIELLQNIYLHNFTIPKEIPKEYNKFGFYILCKFDNFATKITTGNFVDKLTKTDLESYLTYIKNLNSKELQKLYLKICNLSHNIKGGAGLGFLDIIKKSERNFNFKFINYNLDIDFFIFNAIVSTEKTKIYG